jgi:hypothetical protein
LTSPFFGTIQETIQVSEQVSEQETVQETVRGKFTLYKKAHKIINRKPITR